jgi:hypothetical protein
MGEARSLWEIYDSETELWRRGRVILVLIGLFHFGSQGILILSALFNGNLERTFIIAGTVVLFWLLFYFVWIGVHWVRFIWGGWNMIAGFCLLIWAWRDMSGFETLAGSISLLIGAYLCFSPPVYFFAKRQREIVHWPESLLFGAVCFLMLLSIAAATICFSAFRQQREQEACAFADEANQHVYVDQNLEWAATHVTQTSLQQNGQERLRYFFEDTKNRLGRAREISQAKATVSMRFSTPFNIESSARVIATAETDNGPAEVYAMLRDGGDGWQIDRMWWRFLPLSEPWRSAK